MSDIKTKKITLLIIVSILISFFILDKYDIGVNKSVLPQPPSFSNIPEGGKMSEEDKFKVLYFAQQEVKRQLKSPSSARFAPTSQSTIVNKGRGKYGVISYVDADNAYGANLRSKFFCEVIFKDDGTMSGVNYFNYIN